VPLDSREEPVALLREEVAVDEAERVMQAQKSKSQQQISTLNPPMPNSTSRTWSRRPLPDHLLANSRLLQHQLSQKFRQAVIIRRHLSLTISQVRARIEWKPEVDALEAGNGEAKSRRRTLKHLAKGALITATVVGSVAEVVDEAALEDEVTVEMANQDVDVEDIEAAVMRRPPYNNFDLAVLWTR
jgi:hypothetical protein